MYTFAQIVDAWRGDYYENFLFSELLNRPSVQDNLRLYQAKLHDRDGNWSSSRYVPTECSDVKILADR